MIIILISSGETKNPDDLYNEIKAMYMSELEQIDREWFPLVAKHMHMSEAEAREHIIYHTDGVYDGTFFQDRARLHFRMLGKLELKNSQASAMLEGRFEDESNRTKIPIIKRSLLTYQIEFPDLLDYLFTQVDKGKIKGGIRLDITARIADHILKAYENKRKDKLQGKL